MEKKKVIMKDMALRAGVHQTTVSLSLRNDPRIPEATRSRIQKLANEMGYVPDPMLSSLVPYRNRSRFRRHVPTIALVFDIADPKRFQESVYIPSIKRGVMETAEKMGYKAEVLRRGVDYLDSAMLNRVLRTRGIHGVLFGYIECDDLCYELNWEQYSLVKITQAPVSLDIDSVMGNCFNSTRMVMRKLKALGFKRPAMACCRSDEHNTRDYYRAGFEFGQRRHVDPMHHIPLYEFERNPNEILEQEIYEWLRDVKPDVLLSYWNNLLRPAVRVTQEGHTCRFVPLEADECSIVMGGMRNNFDKIAETAVELLISKMRMNLRGIPSLPNLVMVQHQWEELGPWPPVDAELSIRYNIPLSVALQEEDSQNVKYA